jgi:hypothetical protein
MLSDSCWQSCFPRQPRSLGGTRERPICQPSGQSPLNRRRSAWRPPCFSSLYDFLIADTDDCPLAWNGITLYGRFDYGAGYESHGVPFNGNYPNGVETLISKNSNGPRFTIVPNGLR